MLDTPPYHYVEVINSYGIDGDLGFNDASLNIALIGD